jgi:hypothetical protein
MFVLHHRLKALSRKKSEKDSSFQTASRDQKSTRTHQSLAAFYKKCDYSGTLNQYGSTPYIILGFQKTSEMT